MAVEISYVVLGLAALYFGAEWLVKGAARLAGSFGVSPLVIGLTLVAMSTSMPELLVSIAAALRGSSDLALGNIVGSNIANIGLILGLTALVFPVAVDSRLLRRELPLMLGFSFLAYLLAQDRLVGTFDGVLLVLCLVAFNGLLLFLAKAAEQSGDSAIAEFEEYEADEGLTVKGPINRAREAGRVVLGVAVLLVGAQLLVQGATAIARSVGVSELVIGVTLVAFGTSLPELATSLISSFRQEDDIAVGNVIGSNIYNLLAVLGITALVEPVTVAPSLLRVEFPVMLAFSLVVIPFAVGGRLSRWQGGLMFVAYLVFTGYLFSQ